jgi:hypothetical protein
MIFGDFPSTPLIFVITLQNKKTLFCVFLCFRNLPKLKLTWDILGVNNLSREPSREEEVNKMDPRGQTSTGGMGPWTGRATHACLGLGALMPFIFVSWRSALPKNTYIKTPLVFPRGCSGETWNTETEAIPAKIGGGNAAGVALDAPPSLTSTPPSPPWRVSSPPLNYRFVTVDCSIFFYFNV